MIPTNFKLDGKVAVIAGDGQGWQTAMSSYLMEAGAVVCIADELEKTGNAPDCDTLMTLKANLNDPGEVEDAVNKVISKWGKIDILVNNMGQWFAKPLSDTTVEEWNRIMQTNLTGMFLWSKAVGKHMVEAGQGSIINIGSILGERGLANATAFCTGNGGMNQFTKALSLEWAASNVRVNTIGVGWMQKPGQENNKAEGKLERYITLGRFCGPEDIAVMLVYLASGAASYVTGQTFYVSGGVMSHG